MFHRHKWIVLDKQVFPSPYDKAIEAGMNMKGPASPVFFQRDVVVHYKCEKCEIEKVTNG